MTNEDIARELGDFCYKTLLCDSIRTKEFAHHSFEIHAQLWAKHKGLA